MENILNNGNNAQRLLQMTAGTLILLDEQGFCVDIYTNNESPWFLQEKVQKGCNLLKMLPFETYQTFYPNFRKVQTKKVSSSDYYEVSIERKKLFLLFHATL
ncbi:MAG: hypothetical protein J6J26_07505 [Bacteroides sp.]|nr:hypothetical protein [Bacteroidaceae bacterium]MBP3669393.1 hypothetical protein [Bacteroides sp.]